MSQPSPGYAPPQISRRDSQEQIQMMSQRMKQMTLQSSQPIYQSDGFCSPRSPYEHVPSSYVSSSGNDGGGYFGYYTQSSAAPPGNSYSNVVSRGKDVTVGEKIIYVIPKVKSTFILSMSGTLGVSYFNYQSFLVDTCQI